MFKFFISLPCWHFCLYFVPFYHFLNFSFFLHLTLSQMNVVCLSSSAVFSEIIQQLPIMHLGQHPVRMLEHIYLAFLCIVLPFSKHFLFLIFNTVSNEWHLSQLFSCFQWNHSAITHNAFLISIQSDCLNTVHLILYACNLKLNRYKMYILFHIWEKNIRWRGKEKKMRIQTFT